MVFVEAKINRIDAQKHLAWCPPLGQACFPTDGSPTLTTGPRGLCRTMDATIRVPQMGAAPTQDYQSRLVGTATTAANAYIDGEFVLNAMSKPSSTQQRCCSTMLEIATTGPFSTWWSSVSILPVISFWQGLYSFFANIPIMLSIKLPLEA